MPGTTTGLLQRPPAYLSPNEGSGFSSAPRPTTSQRGSGQNGYTDVFLRRSHAILERLRVAVAERENEFNVNF